MEDAFKTRERALENQFFHAVDKTLVERMRDDIAATNCRKRLQDAAGIDDEELMDELIAEGVEPPTLVAFMLLPLAIVAWADGHVDEAEHDVVINTATALGMGADSGGQHLLSNWLEKEPSDALFKIWLDFAAEIAVNLTHVSRHTLVNTILHRSETVAKATGGLLGVGRISPAERHVLNQIKSAFPTATRELP